MVRHATTERTRYPDNVDYQLGTPRSFVPCSTTRRTSRALWHRPIELRSRSRLRLQERGARGRFVLAGDGQVVAASDAHDDDSDPLRIAPARTSHYTEWFAVTDVSGPLVSVPMLNQCFPRGLHAHDPEPTRLVKLAFEE
jgi:hypothetical protein